MKNIITSILIILAFSACRSVKNESDTDVTNPQTLSQFKNDTIKYVKTKIYDHRDKYAHQPLNTLLNDLGFSIRSYIPHITNKGKDCTAIYLNASTPDDDTNTSADGGKPITIIVYFETPLDAWECLKISAKDKSVWTDDAKAFYGNKTLKSIDIMNYMKDAK